MKLKQFSTLLIIILLISCSNNPAIEKRYALEKVFYEAEKQIDLVQGVTNDLTPEVIEQIAKQYEMIIADGLVALETVDSIVYPVVYRHISNLVYKSSSRLQLFYLNNKEFEKSRVMNNLLLSSLNLTPIHQAEFTINLAQAFQIAGLLDSTYYYYLLTLRDYYPPVQENGEIIGKVFSLPLKMYSIASRFDDSSFLNQQFEMAEDYYLTLSKLENQNKLNKGSKLNLLLLYEKEQRWEKEVNILTALLDPSAPEYNNLLFKSADLLAHKLGKNDSALTIYNSIMTSSNQTDTLAVPRASFEISRVEMNKKNYKLAREQLSTLKLNYPDFFSSNSIHQYTYARLFELAGNWDRAESEYNLLIEKYRGSPDAMKSMIYVYDQLIAKNRTIKANQWFGKSVQKLTAIAKTYEGTETEALAMIFIADLQTRIDNWGKSAELLLSVFDKYPHLDIGVKAAVKAADIFRNKLKNAKKADLIISELKTKLTLNR